MAYKVSARAKTAGGSISMAPVSFVDKPTPEAVSEIKTEAKSFYRQTYRGDSRGQIAVDIKIDKV